MRDFMALTSLSQQKGKLLAGVGVQLSKRLAKQREVDKNDSESSSSDESSSQDNQVTKKNFPEDAPCEIFRFNQKSLKEVFTVSKVAIGANHIAVITANTGQLLCWGLNDCMQFGMETQNMDTKHTAVSINSINQILQKNTKKKQQQNTETLAIDEVFMNVATQKQNFQMQNDLQLKQTMHSEPNFLNLLTEQKSDQRTNSKLKGIEVQILQKKKVVMLPIHDKDMQSSLKDHLNIKRILLQESTDRCDETSIVLYDQHLESELQLTFKMLEQLPANEKRCKILKQTIKNNFLLRISQPPFSTQPTQQFLNQIIKDDKNVEKQIKGALTYLHVHPCYLANLYNTGKLDDQQFYQVLKVIYKNRFLTAQTINQKDQQSQQNSFPVSIETERVNLLLICLVKSICEFQKFKDLSEVSLLDCVVGKIFKRIFSSQPKNLGIVSQLVAHTINTALKNLKSNQTTEGDTLERRFQSFETMQSYIEFIKEHIIQTLVSDQILCSNTQFYQHRKFDISLVKSGQTLPSFGFTFEIGILIEYITEELKKLPYKVTDPRVTAEDVIAGKILELTFFKVSKIWANYQLYLFPYLKSRGLIQILQRSIDENFQLIDNVFEVLIGFLCFKQVFQAQKEKPAVQELNSTIQFTFMKQRNHIFRQLCNQSNQVGEEMMILKQFSSLIDHSSQSSGYSIVVKNEWVLKLFKLLVASKNQVAMISPPEEDPLFKCLLRIKPKDIKQLSSSQLKLNTRLFNEDTAGLQQCSSCHTLLTPSFFAIQKHNIFIKYELENKEQLTSVYSELLLNMPGLNVLEPILKQVQKFAESPQIKHYQRELAQKFQDLIFEECNQQDSDSDAIIEARLADLLQQTENRVNLRRKHNHLVQQQRLQINIICNEYEQRLKSQHKMAVEVYQSTMSNVLLGLANRNLAFLSKSQSSLEKMKLVLMQIQNRQVISTPEVRQTRSVYTKSMAILFKEGIVVDLKIQSLKTMVKNLTLTLLITQNHALSVKLCLEDSKPNMLCSSKKQTKTQVLLQFEISGAEITTLRKQKRMLTEKFKFQSQNNTTEEKLSQLSKVTFNDAIEFDVQMFLKVIDQMIKQNI